MAPRPHLIAALALALAAAAGLAAAPASAQPRQVLKVNHLALAANRGVALEDGRDVTAAESTLWLMPGSQFWQLQPSHGTVLPTDGIVSQRGPWGCKAARWGSPVASAPLRAGQYFCVMTRSGGFGEVHVEAVTPTQVTISYTLWADL